MLALGIGKQNSVVPHLPMLANVNEETTFPEPQEVCKYSPKDAVRKAQ